MEFLVCYEPLNRVLDNSGSFEISELSQIFKVPNISGDFEISGGSEIYVIPYLSGGSKQSPSHFQML